MTDGILRAEDNMSDNDGILASRLPSRRSVVKGVAFGAAVAGVGISSSSAPRARAAKTIWVVESGMDYCVPLAASPTGDFFAFAGGTPQQQALYVSPLASFSPDEVVPATAHDYSLVRRASISSDCSDIVFCRATIDAATRIDSIGKVSTTGGFRSGSPLSLTSSESTVVVQPEVCNFVNERQSKDAALVAEWLVSRVVGVEWRTTLRFHVDNQNSPGANTWPTTNWMLRRSRISWNT